MRGWHQLVSFVEVVVQVDFLKKIQARGGQCGEKIQREKIKGGGKIKREKTTEQK